MDPDPDNLWFVCKWCGRAYKQKENLILHKKASHISELKEEKRLKRLQKKIRNGHDVSLAKPLVEVEDVPLIKAAVEDIREVQLLPQRDGSQVFAMETMDHDGIEDCMNEGEQRLESLGPPDPAMADQSNVNESRFHSAQSVNVTDNGNDVDHSSVDLTTAKRRRRGRSSKNKRYKLIENTSKPQETFLETTGACNAEVISINLGNSIPNPIDSNNIAGAKSLSSDKQETDTTAETCLNFFSDGIHSLVSSDNLISESLGAIEICKRGVLVQTEKLDSRTSIVEEDSLELHETSSCSNSTFSNKNSRYNTRIKVERISYAENQTCKKCNSLVAADELEAHIKGCILYRCKHCRLETTDLAIFEDHEIKKHALGPKEKSGLLNAFKSHLKRVKNLEEKTTKDTNNKKEKSRKEKMAKIQEQKVKKKIKQSSTASLTKIERLKCTVCERKFRSIAVLNKHISTNHTSPRKIQSTSPPSETLRDLKFNNSGVKLCMIDPKTMKIEQIQSGNQEGHAQNAKVRGYVCNICNGTFPTVKSGRIHGKAHHWEDFPVSCGSVGCVSRFKSRQSLSAHKRAEHPQNLQKHLQLKIKVKSANNDNNNSSKKPTKKKSKCDWCGREFVKEAWFKNHVSLQCAQNNSKNVSDATDIKPPANLELSQPQPSVTHNKVTDYEFVSRFCGQPHFTESELSPSHEDEDIHRFNCMNTQTEVVNHGR